MRLWRTVLALGLLGCPAQQTIDSGTPDAGAPDAGQKDAGSAPDGGTPDAGQRPIAASATFCSTYGATYCASLQRCGNSSPAVGAHCRAMLTRFCEGSIGARLTAGAATLQLPLAQACLDALVDRPCQSFDARDETNVCNLSGFLGPAGALGSACAGANDCLDGICRRAANDCPKCIAAAPLGAPCRGWFDCSPHTARCASADGGAELLCAPRLADGAECTSPEDCASEHCYRFSTPFRCGKAAVSEPCSVYSDQDCRVGNYCKQPAGGGNVGACAPRVADGQACTDGTYDDGCATKGATCLGGKCTVAAPGSRALGAECDGQFQCQPGLFCRGLTYGQTAAGVCTAWLAAGAACNPAQGNPGCAAGARCLSSQCVAVSPLAGPCTTAAQCGFLLACGAEGTPSTCVGPGMLGQSCLRAAGCESAFCDAPVFFSAPGTCREFLDAGQRCSNARDVVADFLCKSQTCFPPSDGGDFRECVDCLPGQP